MWKMYIAGEFGGMNESLARLALLTGDRTFLDGAKMFDNVNIFPGLAEGTDTVKHLHANQHIPQIMGALLEYRASGDETYLRIARNFFDIVTKHHMYATGGVGQGECFREPDHLAHFIKGDTNCETCATYNLIKIARELYSLDPERSDYMDYIERGLINHILASRSPEITPHMTNGVTYMLPIGPGAEKYYTDNYHSFTCCHGTGMENHVKYGDCIYFIGDKTVYVNQYIPSTLDADEVLIKIDVPFPGSCGKITVSARRDTAVKLRIPAWCRTNPFTVNGKPAETCGRYAVLRCGCGETVTVDVCFDFTARFELLPDRLSEYDVYMVNKNTHYHGDKTPDETAETLDKTPKMTVGALMYGPFVLVTCDDTDGYLHLPAGAEFTASAAAGGLTVTGAGRTFRPLYTVHGRKYHTYFILE